MANALYDKGRQRFATGQINWETDTIKAYLVDTASYTPNLNTHEFVSAVLGGVVAGPVSITNKDATDGACDGDDITFTSVSGASIEAIVIYKETGGGAATDPLIVFIDTATGLPITPNGGDIIVTWDNGPNKIFKL